MTRSYESEDAEITDDVIRKLYLYKDYYIVILQLRDSAQERSLSQKSCQKLEEGLLDKLKYQILDPNELCQAAIKLKQCMLYLRILEINELTEYRSDGTATLQYKPREEYKGT